jgi:hypothetical protein
MLFPARAVLAPARTTPARMSSQAPPEGIAVDSPRRPVHESFQAREIGCNQLKYDFFILIQIQGLP